MSDDDSDYAVTVGSFFSFSPARPRVRVARCDHSFERPLLHPVLQIQQAQRCKGDHRHRKVADTVDLAAATSRIDSRPKSFGSFVLGLEMDRWRGYSSRIHASVLAHLVNSEFLTECIVCFSLLPLYPHPSSLCLCNNRISVLVCLHHRIPFTSTPLLSPVPVQDAWMWSVQLRPGAVWSFAENCRAEHSVMGPKASWGASSQEAEETPSVVATEGLGDFAEILRLLKTSESWKNLVEAKACCFSLDSFPLLRISREMFKTLRLVLASGQPRSCLPVEILPPGWPGERLAFVRAWCLRFFHRVCARCIKRLRADASSVASVSRVSSFRPPPPPHPCRGVQSEL